MMRSMSYSFGMFLESGSSNLFKMERALFDVDDAETFPGVSVVCWMDTVLSMLL